MSPHRKGTPKPKGIKRSRTAAQKKAQAEQKREKYWAQKLAALDEAGKKRETNRKSAIRAQRSRDRAREERDQARLIMQARNAANNNAVNGNNPNNAIVLRNANQGNGAMVNGNALAARRRDQQLAEIQAALRIASPTSGAIMYASIVASDMRMNDVMEDAENAHRMHNDEAERAHSIHARSVAASQAVESQAMSAMVGNLIAERRDRRHAIGVPVPNDNRNAIEGEEKKEEEGLELLEDDGSNAPSLVTIDESGRVPGAGEDGRVAGGNNKSNEEEEAAPTSPAHGGTIDDNDAFHTPTGGTSNPAKGEEEEDADDEPRASTTRCLASKITFGLVSPNPTPARKGQPPKGRKLNLDDAKADKTKADETNADVENQAGSPKKPSPIAKIVRFAKNTFSPKRGKAEDTTAEDLSPKDRKMTTPRAVTTGKKKNSQAYNIARNTKEGDLGKTSALSPENRPKTKPRSATTGKKKPATTVTEPTRRSARVRSKMSAEPREK